jgi:hypothetical protein
MVLIATILLAMVGPPADAMGQLQQLRYTADVAPAEVATALEQGLAAITGDSRTEQCVNEFYIGELYRYAAAADPKSDYAEQAMQHFRAMRIEYLDLAASQLGYIGEARVHRQLGQPEEAVLSLKPLLNGKPNERLHRLAQLETLEVTLLDDPAAVIAATESLGEDGQWLAARAYAKQGQREQALTLLRDEATVRNVASYERLSLIAELGALSDEERSQWAALLAALRRGQEAMGVLDEHAPQESAALYAVLLSNAGRHREAAAQWQRVVDATADPSAMLAMAQSLEAALVEDPAIREQALAAYRDIVEADGPLAIRQQALRAWAYLSGPADSLAVLKAHRELIGTDVYLRYALASAQFTAGDAAGLAGELAAVAKETDDDNLRAAALLLQAWTMDDARAALDFVNNHQSDWEAVPSVKEDVQGLRVELWLRLGMIDSAADAMLGDPSAYPPRALLTMADTLAGRYVEQPEAALRQRVLRLCDAAIGRAVLDESVSIAAAEMLLRIGAFTDAQRVAGAVNGPQALLLQAKALRGMGKQEDALRMLGEADAPEASLLRGLCLLDLDRHQRAAEQFRSGRAAAKVNTEPWWQATLALARVQAASGDREAAAAMLRVAAALYPLDDRPVLQQQLDSLQSEFEP